MYIFKRMRWLYIDMKGLQDMKILLVVCIMCYNQCGEEKYIATCLHLQKVLEQYSHWFLTSGKGNMMAGLWEGDLFFTTCPFKCSIMSMYYPTKNSVLSFTRPYVEMYPKSLYRKTSTMQGSAPGPSQKIPQETKSQ